MVMWEMGFNDGRVCLAMSSVLKSELKKKVLKDKLSISFYLSQRRKVKDCDNMSLVSE